MKRVAALYDIHGNLPALEAVLREVASEKVDAIVVGGDVVPGPMPSAAIATLLDIELPIRFVSGNGEREVLAALNGADLTGVPEQFHEALRWVGRDLSVEHVAAVTDWPSTDRLDVDGLGEVLFCHATPRSDLEIFTRLTPAECLEPVFRPSGSPLVVCGHTHMQFDRRIGDVRVVNAGSVGMPFGSPGADWLLLGPGVEMRHTSYDLEAAASRVRETRYPQAEDFVSDYLLEPPSEEKMLELFERAAIQC